jgi:hypothetical protein
MNQPDLATLLGIRTASEWLSFIMAVLAGSPEEPAIPFPVTSWQSGSVPLALLSTDCESLEDLEASRVAATKAGFLTLALAAAKAGELDPDWVKLWVSSQYQIEPIAQRQTVFSLIFGNESGSEYTFDPGDWQVSYGVYTFTNLVAFKLLTDGTTVDPDDGVTPVVVTVQADAGTPGSLGNIFQAGGPAVSLTILQPTGIDTATVTCQTSAYTVMGRNEETIDELATRAMASWPGLGGGANDLVYKRWALEATDDPTLVDSSGNILRTPRGNSLGITRVYCKENWNGDTATTAYGHYTVFVATDTGDLDVTQLGQAFDYIERRRPGCITLHVCSRPTMTVYIAGTMKYSTAIAPDVAVPQSLLTSALQAYALLLPNANNPALDKLYYTKLTDVLNALSAVYVADNILINKLGGSPAKDDLVITDDGSIVVFDTSNLAWVGS